MRTLPVSRRRLGVAFFALGTLPAAAALGNGPVAGVALPEIDCYGQTLQVQPEDSGSAAWGCGHQTNANSSTDGFLNGQTILASCGADAGGAGICSRLASDDTPWYLPSSRELYCLWVFRDRIGGFQPELYWSSTEATGSASSRQGYYLHFSNGYGTNSYKDMRGRVRCVRSASCSGTPPPAPSASNDGSHCEGGRLRLTASEVPGASYVWTGPRGQRLSGRTVQIDDVTTAAGGTWNVRALVGGCLSAGGPTEVVIHPAPKPTIRLGGPPPRLCPGRTLALIGDGATQGYVWSTGERSRFLTVSKPGLYTVSTTHPNGCSATSAPFRIENRGADAGADQRDVDAPSASLAANREAGAGRWSIAGAADGRGRIASPTDPASGFTGSENETYTLRWTVANECGTTTADTKVSFKGYPRLRCGDRTLVVMPSDSAADRDWGCWRPDPQRGFIGVNTGARSEWEGQENTATIVKHECGKGSAAAVCASLNAANREDWYLPANNELRCLMENRATFGMTSGTYWSSTESQNVWSETAGQAHTYDGRVNSTPKSDKGFWVKVRCVRRAP